MALSTVINGTFFTIKNRVAEGAPDTYTVFTEETNFNFEETRAEIDVSSKSSVGDFQGIPGQYKATFTVDAMIVDADVNIAIIETAIRGAGKGRARRFQNNMEIDQFDYIITSFTRTGGNEAAATYSMSGTLCGQPGAVV